MYGVLLSTEPVRLDDSNRRPSLEAHWQSAPLSCLLNISHRRLLASCSGVMKAVSVLSIGHAMYLYPANAFIESYSPRETAD